MFLGLLGRLCADGRWCARAGALGAQERRGALGQRAMV